MYNMDQVATMDRNSLIATLDDSEKCLLTVQHVLNQRSHFEGEKARLQAQCEKIQKQIKGLPFIPGIIACIVLTLFYTLFFFLLVGVIIAAVCYRNKRRPAWEAQIKEIQVSQIPSVDMQIARCNDNLKQLAPWAANVKSLLSLLPDNHRNLNAIRGIRDQLKRGARDWYTALQGYESVIAREEQQRQMREMQANVQQVAADSQRTAAAVEDVRKQTDNIAKNTARTAAAAESTALHSARTAAAAEDSARSNARSAKAAERTAAAAERQASAAEDAAYWIRNYL